MGAETTANYESCSFSTNGNFTKQTRKLNILLGLSQFMPQTTTHPKGLLASGSTSTFRNTDTKRGLRQAVKPPDPLCTARQLNFPHPGKKTGDYLKWVRESDLWTQ